MKGYIKEQEKKKRIAILLAYQENPVGYLTIVKEPECGPSVEQKIPGIVDFNVLISYQKRRFGSKLLGIAEKIGAEMNDIISLAVGLHWGYGQAQRMYIKRGYILEKSGVFYD